MKSGFYLFSILGLIIIGVVSCQSDSIPAMTESGREIAFSTISQQDGVETARLNVIDLETKEIVDLADTEFAARNFAWSPDGSQIAFRQPSEDIFFEILVGDPDRGEFHPIMDLQQYKSAFSWSPDGSQLAFLSSNAKLDWELYIADVNGEVHNQILMPEHIHSLARFPTVNWNDDDNPIVVGVRAFPEDFGGMPIPQILAVNSDGSEIKRISDEDYDHALPVLSPDGERILTYVPGEDDWWRTIIMDSDGGNVELLFDRTVIDLAWSPDGSHIAYGDGSGGIYILDVSDDSELVEVHIAQMIDAQDPAWSPDGEWIAFAGLPFDEEFSQLYVVRADGSDLTALTDEQVDHGFPLWRPVGN